jgi:hypothetical protein
LGIWAIPSFQKNPLQGSYQAQKESRFLASKSYSINLNEVVLWVGFIVKMFLCFLV